MAGTVLVLLRAGVCLFFPESQPGHSGLISKSRMERGPNLEAESSFFKFSHPREVFECRTWAPLGFLCNSFPNKPGRGFWWGVKQHLLSIIGPSTGLKALYVKSFSLHKNLCELVIGTSVVLAKKLKFREDMTFPKVTQLVSGQAWNWMHATWNQRPYAWDALLLERWFEVMWMGT